MQDLGEDLDNLQNDKIYDLHTSDKVYFSNLLSPEIDFVQLNGDLLTDEQLDKLNIWDVFNHINRAKEDYKKIKYISMAIQFMNKYDIMGSDESPTLEDISIICKDLTVLIAPNLPDNFMNLILQFFLAFAQYEDNNSLMPSMCYEIFRINEFRQRLFNLIDIEIEKRGNPSYNQQIIYEDPEKNSLVLLIAKIFSSYFQKTNNFDKLNVNLGDYASFVLTKMNCPALLDIEKLEFLRSLRKLTFRFRSNPQIDIFLDIIKENFRRINDIENMDIALLKFIRCLVFKRDEDLLNHIFFETKLPDGNPLINFIRVCLDNEENQTAQLYAMRVLFKILVMNSHFFYKLDINIDLAFHFLVSNDLHISYLMLSEVLNLVGDSKEATSFLCQHELLQCLNEIYDSRDINGKLKIFSILRKIIIDYKDLISPEYINENIIPMTVDILRFGKDKQIKSVFSILQSLFRADERDGNMYQFKEVFCENEGLDALNELLEDSSNDEEKNRIQAFINNLERSMNGFH